MVIDLNDLKRRMEGALNAFKNDLKGLRTGRAAPEMLDTVQVEAYGSFMPLSQMGSISAPEPRLLTVQVWDGSNVKAVEKAIINSGLGLNPQVDGALIRIPTPDLSEERRKELVKLAHKYAEQQKVAIRNIRRDGMDSTKKAQKEKGISEDQVKGTEADIQKATDDFIKKIDDLLAGKEKEILHV